MTDFEHASNSFASESTDMTDSQSNHNLSNSDFRKLLMTPRPNASQHRRSEASINEDRSKTRDSGSNRGEKRRPRRSELDSDPKTKSSHQKRHHHHQRNKRDPALKDPNDPSQSQPRYRDRAKERREGRHTALPAAATNNEDGEIDQDTVDQEEVLTRTADYRAVAPTTANESHAERRRTLIQESKYLGGDMEHTHLVKGLDYVLLQKVRLEIQSKEHEAEQVLDAELEKVDENVVRVADDKSASTAKSATFRTRMAGNIFDLLFNQQQQTPVERNEYFQSGRMAYRIELEDDSVDFEVPATVIRSKSDCQQSDTRSQSAISTNEIVINKLTQILSYLRAGKRHAKKGKLKGRFDRDEEVEDELARRQTGRLKLKSLNGPASGHAGDRGGGDIFEGVGSDYVPTTSRKSEGDKAGEHTSRSGKSSSYFDDRGKRSTATADSDKSNTAVDSLKASQQFAQDLDKKASKDKDKDSLERFFAKTKVTCYDECYPGFAESYDAMGDSDDEVDFSKMDAGNKKGPVGRWDFETQEEYSQYMSNKEAMPKAAFQYGVKMADGRKTRRLGVKDEKAELDRQLQQIQSIIHKRKRVGDGEGPGPAKNPHV